MFIPSVFRILVFAEDRHQPDEVKRGLNDMIYDLLAPIYDRVNGDIDYSAWADFVEENIKRYNPDMKTELVLDLGCGTGKMTLELARRGYDMTGVDLSAEMLDIARNSAERAGLSDKMLWLLQDITEFELYGTVELAVSCLDTLNHLTSQKELKKCLSLVHNYLVPDGLFLFDINGKHKFEKIYADNSYIIEEEGTVCIWQNSYNPKTRLCDFYITLFEEGDDGRYSRCLTDSLHILRGADIPVTNDWDAHQPGTMVNHAILQTVQQDHNHQHSLWPSQTPVERSSYESTSQGCSLA